jgi:spermidine synthase
VARHLREFLPAAKSVLVLGSGLGRIVHVMRTRGYDPRFTLVEKDKTVLGWALEILGEGTSSRSNRSVSSRSGGEGEGGRLGLRQERWHG